jgi:hypothetical protein
MDYEKIYSQLIERSQSENRKKGCGIYFERHHIVPKCMGGRNDKINLVLLTAREHYIAHKLLCKIYPNEIKLQYALWAMINLSNRNQNRSYIISSADYESARNQYIQLMRRPKSDLHKKKLSNAWTDIRRKASSETLSRTNKQRIGILHPNFGKKHSDETKKKMSLAQSNKTISDETKKKISAALLGYTHSDETKQRMKNSAINKPFIKCPHCLLQSKSKGNMNRYHFNNCKNMEINNGRL